jgi:hypothetical protein
MASVCALFLMLQTCPEATDQEKQKFHGFARLQILDSVRIRKGKEQKKENEQAATFP